MITAAFAETVVIPVAETDVEDPPGELIEPGVTSKGVAPVVFTLKNAEIAPIELFAPEAKVNEYVAGSEAPATLYKTAPYLELLPASCDPAIKVQPDDVGVPLLPTCAMFTIITSPATTPVGLFMVRVELEEFAFENDLKLIVCENKALLVNNKNTINNNAPMIRGILLDLVL
jgi:hypothetical protein